MTKKLFNFRTKDKIYYSYLISYFIIGVLPVIISLLGYMNYEKIVYKEILTSQSYKLSQLKNSFDNDIETIRNTNRLLSSNNNINSLVNSADFTKDELLQAVNLKEEIDTMKVGMNYCSDVFVYFYKSKSFVTDSKIYPWELNDIYAKSYQISLTKLLNAINTPNHQGYSIIKNEDGNYILLFLQNVYNYRNKAKLATIATVVPWNSITANIASMEQGKIFWLNEKNQVLEGNETDVFDEKLTYNEYVDENKPLFTKLGNVEYVISFMSSNFFDFKYCITMPRSYYFKEISHMKYVISIQVIAMVILAMLLSRYYSYKNYKTISKIITLLRKNKKVVKDLPDFENIETHIENLYKENQSLNNSSYQVKEALMNQVVTGFIKGWNYDESILEETITANSKVSLNEPFITMVITHQDIAECNLFAGINDSEKKKTYQLFKFVFKNIFDENILSKHKGLICDIEGMHLCIINMNDEDLKNGTLTYDIRKCLDIYKKLLNIKVNIAASKINRKADALPRAYNEAVQVLSFQSFWGKEYESFAFYEDTNMECDMSSNYDGQMVEKQKKLYNLIVAKEYEKAAELMNQTLEEIFIEDIQYMDINKCRMFSLINMVYNCLNDIIGKSDGEFFKKLQPMQRMLEANSINSARKIMNDIFKETIEHLKLYLINDQPKWIQEVIDFIDENYDDPNLNISILADKLDMNLSYIGRAFKNYIGYGITDLIHLKRIEECKKHLISGESVREVAESIGYLDSKSLIRIFKKYEGITPGQFKSNCENDIAKFA